jgi:predicted metallopeptidase
MPISFVIEVRQTDSEEEKLKTLAHEMVHVRQYIRGELNEEMSVWRGKKVDSDEIPYAEQPWEIEAESIAHKLYDEYISK